MHQFFKSDFFNFESLRILSFAPYEACEVAEFVSTVSQIRDGDPESWYRAWMGAADRAESLADDAYLAQNRVEARKGYMRAASYQRAAQFMLNGRNPARDQRILAASETAISSFRKATELMDETVICLDIPYENGVSLPAYLYLPAPQNRLPGKIPIMVNTVGGDATQEEIFVIQPAAGVKLGYAILTFEGPGQGIVLRRDQLPLRPDWEVVIKVVLDFLLDFVHQHPEHNIDLDRLAIAGSSVGAYLALRGAADPRIKACVSVDPFFSMWDLLKGRMPEFLIHTFEAGGFAADYMWDYLISVLGWFDFQTKWEFNHLRWMFGKDSTADVFHEMMRYSLASRDKTQYLHKVKCPVMVTGAAHSIYAKPEISTMRIMKTLSHIPEDKKLMWIATDPADGGLQSKVGAFGTLTQKTYAWLDEMFQIDRTPRKA